MAGMNSSWKRGIIQEIVYDERVSQAARIEAEETWKHNIILQNVLRIPVRSVAFHAYLSKTDMLPLWDMWNEIVDYENEDDPNLRLIKAQFIDGGYVEFLLKQRDAVRARIHELPPGLFSRLVDFTMDKWRTVIDGFCHTPEYMRAICENQANEWFKQADMMLPIPDTALPIAFIQSSLQVTDQLSP